MDPLSIILIKIFVKGFYKAHAGLLLFLFVTLISYAFFIQVLNIDSTHEEAMMYNFIFILKFISSPVIAMGVFFVWLLWTFKIWKYISEVLVEPQNRFFYYSAISLEKRKQFLSWFYVQILLSLPIIIYAIFSLVAGLIVGDYLIPGFFVLYIVAVSVISAFVYVRWANNPFKVNRKNIFTILTVNWNKPFFSLFLYYLFNRLKVPLIVTKLLSYGVITGGYFLVEQEDIYQFGGILILGVVVSHSFLIYQSYQFEYYYLSFTRNFPSRKIKLYTLWVLTYLLLTLPETLWLVVSFPPKVVLLFLLFSVGTYMIFRSILYTSTLEMKKYIYIIFLLFVVAYLVILYGYFVYLSVFNFLLSILIFEVDYFKQQTFFKSHSNQ